MVSPDTVASMPRDFSAWVIQAGVTPTGDTISIFFAIVALRHARVWIQDSFNHGVLGGVNLLDPGCQPEPLAVLFSSNSIRCGLILRAYIAGRTRITRA